MKGRLQLTGREAWVTSAILINCFEVPPESDERFLALWRQADRLLQEAGGYRSTRLHKALRLDTHFRYINVAELDSVAIWQTVVGGSEFGALSRQMAEFNPSPGLYTVEISNAVEGKSATIPDR